MGDKIIQIIPAPVNMWARFKGDEGFPDEFDRIVCLALMQDEAELGFTYVVPMACLEGEGEILETTIFSNFDGIVFSENPYEDYKED